MKNGKLWGPQKTESFLGYRERMENGELLNIFIQNLKLAGGEVLEKIPDNWYITNAKFGIAENGAVWVENYNKELFLSEYVAIKMPKIIVPTMQNAMN